MAGVITIKEGFNPDGSKNENPVNKIPEKKLKQIRTEIAKNKLGDLKSDLEGNKVIRMGLQGNIDNYTPEQLDKLEQDKKLEILKMVINDPKEIKKVFTDTSKLKSFNDLFNSIRSKSMNIDLGNKMYMKMEGVVIDMVNKIKGDDKLLLNIVQINIDNDLGDGFVAINALKAITNKREEIYKNLLPISSKNYYIQEEIIKNIKDKDILLKFVNNEIPNYWKEHLSDTARERLQELEK